MRISSPNVLSESPISVYWQSYELHAEVHFVSLNRESIRNENHYLPMSSRSITDHDC